MKTEREKKRKKGVRDDIDTCLNDYYYYLLPSILIVPIVFVLSVLTGFNI